MGSRASTNRCTTISQRSRFLSIPFFPNPLRAGTRTLQLDNKFAAQMRLSPKYPAKVGANGFVVLLHDPHDNIAGRAETLAGLRSLISANSRVPFTFLVEGAYQDPRNIGFSGLDMLINTGSDTSTAVVYSLLNRYMINTPMAYRLLYDRKIQATAIDNNELLRYPAPRPNHTIRQQLNALTKLERAIEAPGLPKEVSGVKGEISGSCESHSFISWPKLTMFRTRNTWSTSQR